MILHSLFRADYFLTANFLWNYHDLGIWNAYYISSPVFVIAASTFRSHHDFQFTPQLGGVLNIILQCPNTAWNEKSARYFFKFRRTRFFPECHRTAVCMLNRSGIVAAIAVQHRAKPFNVLRFHWSSLKASTDLTWHGCYSPFSFLRTSAKIRTFSCALVSLPYPLLL